MTERNTHPGEGYPMTWSVIQPCVSCGCPVLMHNGIAVSVVLGEEHICGITCACEKPKVEESQS